MKAIVFDANITKYVRTLALGKLSKKNFYGPFSCISLKEIEKPKLPSDDYVLIKTKFAGICGSDLNLIFLHDSPSTSPFASFPFVIGHENLGVIVEKGKNVMDFNVGDRVIADPVLDCYAREIDDICESCKEHEYSTCLNITEGKLSPGTIMGACNSTSGSWGEYYIAHKSQLLKVPNEVKDEEAILTDALASAVHPVMRNFPKDNQKVLVYGAGIIGLLIIWTLRKLGSKANISCVAKYKFQQDLAKEFGADNIIYPSENYFEDVAKITNAKIFKPMIGDNVMLGGFDIIYDCVASNKTIRDSLWMTKQRGTYVLVGLASFPKGIDFTPVWFKELKITGAYCYSTEILDGKEISTYELALKLIQENKIPYNKLITHIFSIDEYKKAIETASSKNREKSIKVVFKF
ncbi:zinc-binding dehydrogenase [Caldicellulosiruptoraceae bacterium PP1]